MGQNVFGGQEAHYLLDTLLGFCPRYLRREGGIYIGSVN